MHDIRSFLRSRWLLILSVLLGLAGVGVLVEWVTRPEPNPNHSADVGVRSSIGDPPPPLVPPLPARPDTNELVAEGMELADELAAIDPEVPAVIASSGQLCYVLGDSAKAFDRWQSALDGDPVCAGALSGMAEYCHEKGDFEQAVAHMRRMASAHPEAARDKTFLLADSLLNLGEAQALIDALDVAAKTGPLPPWAVVMLGQAYYQLEDYEKAVFQFRVALKQEPESSTAHYVMALALARLGRSKEAGEHRKEYAELKKKDMQVYDRVRGHGTQKERHSTDKVRSIVARFHFEAGVLLVTKGRRDDAERHLLRAWALAPEQPQPRQVLEDLRRR